MLVNLCVRQSQYANLARPNESPRILSLRCCSVRRRGRPKAHKRLPLQRLSKANRHCISSVHSSTTRFFSACTRSAEGLRQGRRKRVATCSGILPRLRLTAFHLRRRQSNDIRPAGWCPRRAATACAHLAKMVRVITTMGRNHCLRRAGSTQ